MSLNFDLIPLLTAELAALERLKNIVSPGFLGHFYSEFFILASFLECLNLGVFKFGHNRCFKIRATCLAA